MTCEVYIVRWSGDKDSGEYLRVAAKDATLDEVAHLLFVLDEDPAARPRTNGEATSIVRVEHGEHASFRVSDS